MPGLQIPWFSPPDGRLGWLAWSLLRETVRVRLGGNTPSHKAAMSSIRYREKTFMPENAGQNQGCWEKGQSGSPRGKPKGARHHATRIVEKLLDKDVENIHAYLIEQNWQAYRQQQTSEASKPPREDRVSTMLTHIVTAFMLAAIEIAARLGCEVLGLMSFERT
jgi:hypothetical protein